MIKIWYKNNLFSWLLYPISLIYGLVSKINIYLRSKKAYKSKAFVISIGNINIGGAGKTPLTVSLANFLSSEGKKVAVVGHGYKSSLQGPEVIDDSFDVLQVGDEAKQMLKLLDPYVMMLVGKNRVDCVRLAEERGADIIILDDAYTATYIQRDFNLLVLDGKVQLGNQKVIPSGPLREPFSGIKRADAMVVINRHRNLEFAFDKKIYYLKTKIKFNKSITTDPLYAFCGLALPDKFYNSLNKEGLCLQEKRAFPDHYLYKDEDLEKLISKAAAKNLKLVTTLKDIVKISSKYHKHINLVELDLELTKIMKQDLLKLIESKNS